MKQEISTDDDGSSYIYYPIIEYKVDDNTIRATMDSGSSVVKYDIDEEINILYNPDKPKEFIIKGEKSSSIIGIVVMAVGTLVTVLGIKMALQKN